MSCITFIINIRHTLAIFDREFKSMVRNYMYINSLFSLACLDILLKEHVM